MKRSFFLLCAVLLVLGSVLPLAGQRLACAILQADRSPAASTVPAEPDAASGEAAPLRPAFAEDAEIFLLEDQASGEVFQTARREYLLGAAAAEMPIDWPDEALKAQIIAAHSYALYCRDHSSAENGSWLSVDPARRQGWLSEPVLRSYWGTDFEANYARLAALVDEVETLVVCWDERAAGTSYFSLSNGRTEASENVWGAPLPYLVAVDSSTDCAAPNYEFRLTLSAEQMLTALAGLGLTPDPAAPVGWFGEAKRSASGYVRSLLVCGQSITGTALRRALGLRSTDFTVQYADGSFAITTRGYGHGVGLSQWGAKALAEQGLDCTAILAHYFPGTTLCG